MGLGYFSTCIVRDYSAADWRRILLATVLLGRNAIPVSSPTTTPAAHGQHRLRRRRQHRLRAHNNPRSEPVSLPPLSLLDSELDARPVALHLSPPPALPPSPVLVLPVRLRQRALVPPCPPPPPPAMGPRPPPVVGRLCTP